MLMSRKTFWVGTARVSDLLKQLATANRYCEGDHVPVSVMPRVWGHITGQLCRDNLLEAGWSEEEVTTILTAINKRMKMNIRPVTLAAYVLDPRFHSRIGAERRAAENRCPE